MNNEKNSAFLLIIISLVVMITVFGYSVFDSPKFNPIKTELITSSVAVTDSTTADESVININSATVEELMKLKNIGEKKAEAIIKYRELNGPFRSPDELKAISGITQKIIDANAGRIAV